MWISSTTQYAIRAVLFVAEHSADRPLRVEAIAEALQVPRNYLSKTLHLLAREGVLRSERGRGGGFRLGADPSALTLAAVAAPFGDLASRHCLLGRSSCGWRSPCAVHAR
ncbi:MAG TPA: Rrf2 family transcriptional regulator, partial [Gemmatimonadaceae bacterium]